MMRVALLLRTVRHLTIRQIVVRVSRLIRMRLRPRITVPDDVRVAPHVPLWTSPRQPVVPREEPPVDWQDPSLTRLQRFHLHYFEHVHEQSYEAFRDLSRSWMRANERIAGDGWHPYTISMRVPNWCHALTRFDMEPDFARELVRSAYAQLRFLAANIELDVRGNHLIENLRALIWGGIVFEGEEPRRWLRTAMAILRDEVAEQVLADGGHFERVPAYHVVVLRDLLEIALFLRRNGRPAEWLEEAVGRMLEFLDQLIMADGSLPLLKDTTYGGLDPHEVLAAGAIFTGQSRFKRSDDAGSYARLLFDDETLARFEGMTRNDEPRSTRWLEPSGYAVLRHGRHSLIADVGVPCPEYLPAHAHADFGSYELCLDGERVIVDSGVATYEAGEWRDWFRSTRAHNTVEVAGENQSEVWSSFRVARRAKPRNVSFDGRVLRAEHDGYLRLSPPVLHRRTLVWHGSAIVVYDELLGQGSTSARNFVHFHPRRTDSARMIRPFGHGRLETEPSWYSEHFGERVQNRALVLTYAGALPFAFGYVIAIEPVDMVFEAGVIRAAGVMIAPGGQVTFD